MDGWREGRVGEGKEKDRQTGRDWPEEKVEITEWGKRKKRG